MSRALIALVTALLGALVGATLLPRVLGAQAGRYGPPVHREWSRGLVVALAAGAFGVMGGRFGWSWELPAFVVLAASLVVVSLVDLRHFVVPNQVVAATLALSVPLLAVAAVAGHRGDDLGRAAIGAALASGVLLVMNLLNPRWMGMGDVKLAVVLGLFLGWLGLGHVAAGLFLGFLVGAVVGVVLLATGVRTRRDHLPFAPFLATGTMVAVAIGRQLIDWYVR
ncbi:MAG: prepilin peptidase [Acidobacteria bacterium]|nr:prepilin peptidase [Acidobacteriota bacterium]